MDAAWREVCQRLEVTRGSGIRLIDLPPGGEAVSPAGTFRQAAASLGYITIEAHRDLPEAVRRRLCHRHVVLVHQGHATPISIRWIRELAAASPRAHVLITVREPDRVHEGAGGPGDQLAPLPATHRERLAFRGARLRRSRRWAAALRWTGAAVERSRRNADETGAALAYAELCRLAETHSEEGAARVITRGRRLLGTLGQLSARSHVVSCLAGALIAQAEFEAATAALSGVDVECTLVGVEVPAWIRSRQAEVSCWLGRWEEAEEQARAAGHHGWRAVAAMARRDWMTVRTLGAATPLLRTWQPVVAMLSAAAASDRCGVVKWLEAAAGRERPARWRDALVLESLRLVGAADEWDRWIRRTASRRRGPAESLLWQWVTRDSDAVPSSRRTSVESAVRQLGAPGVCRWGHERETMQTWTGVLALLRHVQEADEALAALRHGCRWAREYTGVDTVAIASVDDVVACDPEEHLRSLRATVRGGSALFAGASVMTEPVRYGGLRIGEVRFLGRGRDAPECRAVAAALAIACGPALRARLDELQVSNAGGALAGELLGVSPVMQALRGAVARAAGSDFRVLIEGESGTGKELVARALHRLSARRDRRWTAVNCAALTDDLIEAELFGHTRGAFTGAMAPRVGLLEDAHEGTLFLDEIAELSPRAQAKLLRVLQEGEVRRLGENTSRRVDVRLIAATNRPLADIARQGAYREDLLFRLAVIRLRVPSLRERIEDIPILAQAFWQTAAARASTRAMLGPDAIAAMCRAPWPGNVRQLQNAVAALAVGGPTRGRLSARHVADVLSGDAAEAGAQAPVSLAEARVQCDRRVIAASLARHAGNRTAAARELGVSRQGLAGLVTRLGLEEPAGA